MYIYVYISETNINNEKTTAFPTYLCKECNKSLLNLWYNL